MKLLVILLCCVLSCSNEIVTKDEIIHPPVGLSITESSGIYLVTFSADNRETNFTGYGFFQAASQADLNTAPSDTLANDATFFCALTTSQLSYESQSTIQLGSGTQSSGVLCQLSSFTPVSNNYLAMRARVNRDQNTWSEPAIVQIP